jgi:hypothetical protein
LINLYRKSKNLHLKIKDVPTFFFYFSKVQEENTPPILKDGLSKKAESICEEEEIDIEDFYCMEKSKIRLSTEKRDNVFGCLEFSWFLFLRHN